MDLCTMPTPVQFPEPTRWSIFLDRHSRIIYMLFYKIFHRLMYQNLSKPKEWIRLKRVFRKVSLMLFENVVSVGLWKIVWQIRDKIMKKSILKLLSCICFWFFREFLRKKIMQELTFKYLHFLHLSKYINKQHEFCLRNALNYLIKKSDLIKCQLRILKGPKPFYALYKIMVLYSTCFQFGF